MFNVLYILLTKILADYPRYFRNGNDTTFCRRLSRVPHHDTAVGDGSALSTLLRRHHPMHRRHLPNRLMPLVSL